jgi:hydroxyacylglutathione hydrolase
MDVGGHTLGHIAYYFPEDKTVFVGDSLFALGCGKMFEGTPSQFWTSLKGLRDLPDDTTVYCAHEYTESNAKFALSVEPGNEALQQRAAEIKSKRSRGEPTVPSLLGEEKKTNPFLRADLSEEIRKNVGVKDVDSDADAFGKVRRAKDTFRG